MKIIVHLKDPDGFSDSVKHAIQRDVAKLEGLSDDERDDLVESREEKAWESLSRFVEYQELVTIEFDTETGAATVLPRK